MYVLVCIFSLKIICVVLALSPFHVLIVTALTGIKTISDDHYVCKWGKPCFFHHHNHHRLLRHLHQTLIYFKHSLLTHTRAIWSCNKRQRYRTTAQACRYTTLWNINARKLTSVCFNNSIRSSTGVFSNQGRGKKKYTYYSSRLRRRAVDW